MRLYLQSKAQKIVEILFILAVLPLSYMIEQDIIPAEYGLYAIGALLAITVFNTAIGNLIMKYDRR